MSAFTGARGSSDIDRSASLAARSSSDRSDRVVSFLTVELVLVVATQKLAIPLGAGTQISLAFVLHYLSLLFLSAAGCLALSKPRLILFCLFAIVASLTQLGYSNENSSLSSLALMLLTAAMFVFVVPLPWVAYRELLRRFVLLAIAASSLVGLDWLVQLAHFNMPDVEAVIPFPLIYQAYNYIQPINWGSNWMKPNGVFFLETSHVSQFIALGLVVEITLFRNVARLGALLLGLGATLGGTGMLLLVTCLPLLLAKLPRRVVLASLALAPILLIAAAQGHLLDQLTKRTSEFSQNSSSGFNRFILPMQWSVNALEGPTEQAWLGKGAGSMPKTVNNDEEGIVGYAWPPYTKVGVEYGLVTLAVWLAYVITSVLLAGAPAAIAWAAFIQFQFLNGSLNVPIHTFYCVFLCAGFMIDADSHGGLSHRVRLPIGRRKTSPPTANSQLHNLY